MTELNSRRLASIQTQVWGQATQEPETSDHPAACHGLPVPTGSAGGGLWPGPIPTAHCPHHFSLPHRPICKRDTADTKVNPEGW